MQVQASGATQGLGARSRCRGSRPRWRSRGAAARCGNSIRFTWMVGPGIARRAAASVFLCFVAAREFLTLLGRRAAPWRSGAAVGVVAGVVAPAEPRALSLRPSVRQTLNGPAPLQVIFVSSWMSRPRAAPPRYPSSRRGRRPAAPTWRQAAPLHHLRHIEGLRADPLPRPRTATRGGRPSKNNGVGSGAGAEAKQGDNKRGSGGQRLPRGRAARSAPAGR